MLRRDEHPPRNDNNSYVIASASCEAIPSLIGSVPPGRPGKVGRGQYRGIGRIRHVPGQRFERWPGERRRCDCSPHYRCACDLHPRQALRASAGRCPVPKRVSQLSFLRCSTPNHLRWFLKSSQMIFFILANPMCKFFSILQNKLFGAVLSRIQATNYRF